jgi:secreted trypsin-like serine protease
MEMTNVQQVVVNRHGQPSRWAHVKSRLAVVAAASAVLVVSIAGPAEAIVDGQAVSGDDYPWAAAFIEPGDGAVEGRFYCSGALIKPQWVLTARHCQPDAGDIVTLGRTRLASSQGERRSVDFTVVDGGRVPVLRYMTSNFTYCPASLDNREAKCDLALVRLNAPSTHPDLDLADAAEVSQWGEGTEARVYGYGRDHVGELRRARMRITDLRDNHYTLFAQGIDGVSCHGDSGAPLIVSTSNGPRVVGVNHGGTGHVDPDDQCTTGVDKSYVKVGWRDGPEVNARPFLWIANTI